MSETRCQFVIGILLSLAITSTTIGEESDPPRVMARSLRKTSAPRAIAAGVSTGGGALEVCLLGDDGFEDVLKYGNPKVFVVPVKAWQGTKGGIEVERHRIAGSPPLLVEGISPGKYWVGVKTSFKLQVYQERGLRLELIMPHEFYCWDGWENNPVLDIKEKVMYYCTWYPAWIESGKTGLVVAIRMKEGDVDDRLLALPSREPAYSFGNAITGKNAKEIKNSLRRYGKAFIGKDSILSLTRVDGGLHHSMKGQLARKKRKELEQRLLANLVPLPVPSVGPSPKPASTPVTGDKGTTEKPKQPIAPVSALLPPYKTELRGHNEVRIVNPNNFKVAAGLRLGKQGIDFEIPAQGRASVDAPDGRYDIYFVYSNKPKSLFQGDSFSLKHNGVEIQIAEVIGGNYAIRQVK